MGQGRVVGGEWRQLYMNKNFKKAKKYHKVNKVNLLGKIVIVKYF